jgi:RNA polymerase sigma-70 factor, ECF subfamily
MISTPDYTEFFDRHGETWYSSLYEEVFLSLINCSYNIIRNETEAEEIAGRCFWALHFRIQQDPPKFADRAYVKNYLYRMVKNASVDYKRSGKADFMITHDPELIENLDAEQLTAELEEADTHQKILDLVAGLSPMSKEIIRLFFYENMSTEEVAQKLGQSVKNIYTAKQRAMVQLRKMATNKKQSISPDTLLLLFWIYLTNP